MLVLGFSWFKGIASNLKTSPCFWPSPTQRGIFKRLGMITMFLSLTRLLSHILQSCSLCVLPSLAGFTYALCFSLFLPLLSHMYHEHLKIKSESDSWFLFHLSHLISFFCLLYFSQGSHLSHLSRFIFSLPKEWLFGAFQNICPTFQSHFKLLLVSPLMLVAIVNGSCLLWPGS